MDRIESILDENSKLQAKLNHIETCLLILKNTKSDEGLKDLPDLLNELYEYVSKP